MHLPSHLIEGTAQVVPYCEIIPVEVNCIFVAADGIIILLLRDIRITAILPGEGFILGGHLLNGNMKIFHSIKLTKLFQRIKLK
jgi:hypothetical protein